VGVEGGAEGLEVEVALDESDVSRTPIVTLEVQQAVTPSDGDEPGCRNQRPPATARARTFA